MTEVIKVKILHLVLKKKWYEMQERGEKTEEYREITPYWIKRLVDTHRLGQKMLCNIPDVAASLIGSGCVKLNPYTHVCFHYGYTQRCFINRIDSITIGRGNPEWGAPTDRDVFIIKHHKESSPFVVGKDFKTYTDEQLKAMSKADANASLSRSDMHRWVQLHNATANLYFVKNGKIEDVELAGWWY